MRNWQRLREMLEEQRHLLQKSVNDIAGGDLVEALRVATVIRTLVHETGSSKPLLQQLDQNYLQLDILDVEPPKHEPLPPGTVAVDVLWFPVRIFVKSGVGAFLNAELNVENRGPSTLGKWWQRREALIVPGAGGFSRKQVVLGLANKEGGTHVDPVISKRYQDLMECDSVHAGWQEKVTPLNLSRYMAGQCGVELLWYLNKHFPPRAPDIRMVVKR